MRGVSVRPRPRLPRARPPPGLATGRPALYSPGDACDRHPRPQQLGRSSRSRSPPTGSTAPSATPSAACRGAPGSPGFRPGKAPRPILERVLGPGAVLDEAVEHLVQDRLSRGDRRAGHRPADERRRRGRRGDRGQAAALQGDRPGPPGGRRSATTRTSSSHPRSRPSTTPRSTRSSRSCATRTRRSRRSRTAGRRTATGPSSAFAGTRDGVPFDGGTTERMPLIIGEDRLIPGFEANLVGLKAGRRDRLRHHVPRGLPGGRASRASRSSSRSTSRSSARRSCPRPTTTFAQSMGDYADLAALKADIAERLRRNALDRARHEFSDKIIDYAVANATIELPDDPGGPGGRGHARRVPPARSRGRASPSPRTSRPPRRPRPTSTPSSARAPSSA